MFKYLKVIIFILMLFIILSCVETKSYSGKLIAENFKYDYIRSVFDHWALKNSNENNLTTDLHKYYESP